MSAIVWVAVLQAAAVLQGERPVTFTQQEMQWPVVASADATLSAQGGELFVKFSRLHLADQPANPSSIPYVSYRVCLARKADNSQQPWASVACSDPVSIMVMPQSDETVKLPKRKLVIPLLGQTIQVGDWMVLEFTPRTRPGEPVDVVNALSSQGLFGTAP